MKKSLIFALCLTGCIFIADAQSSTRGRNTTPDTRPATTTQRPAATTQRPATTTQRPAATTQRPATTTQRPTTTTQRPSAPSTTQRPSTPQANPRPSTPNPPHASQRPPTPNVRPSAPPPPPPQGYRPDYHYRPPMPHTPPSYTYYRPTPPPSWRPTVHSPNFSTVLGLALGSIFSNSINALFSSGYNVAGYTDNRVYLSNISYCNLNWPNATLFYNNGRLTGSLFSAATLSYDISRYNYVYNTLTAMYGYPQSTQSLGNGGMSSTWWGIGNTYITLSYYPEYIAGTGTRFFTTVATGN